MEHEFTSEEVASFASRGLDVGKVALTDAQFRAVSASVLTQARPRTLPIAFGAGHEFTSEEIASFASVGLRLGGDALTDAQFLAVCGSALTQARPRSALASLFAGRRTPRNALLDDNVDMYWSNRQRYNPLLAG